MAYEKRTWTANELVTAEKLNHIETGIEMSPQRNNAGTSYGCIYPNIIVPYLDSENSRPDSKTNTGGNACISFYDSNERVFGVLRNVVDETSVAIQLETHIPIGETGNTGWGSKIGVKYDRNTNKVSYLITSPEAFIQALGEDSTNTNTKGKILRCMSDKTFQEMCNSDGTMYSIYSFVVKDNFISQDYPEGRALGNFGTVVLTKNYVDTSNVYQNTFFQNSVYTNIRSIAYKDTGERVSLEFGCIARKDGTSDYFFSSPTAFRRALGMQEIANGSLAINSNCEGTLDFSSNTIFTTDYPDTSKKTSHIYLIRFARAGHSCMIVTTLNDFFDTPQEIQEDFGYGDNGTRATITLTSLQTNGAPNGKISVKVKNLSNFPTLNPAVIYYSIRRIVI